MKKGFGAVLVLVLLLTACSAGEKQTQFQTGEEVSTYWFDFTVQSVETADRYEGCEPDPGSRLVLCQIAMENTFDGPVPMGQGDFILMWEDPDGGQGAGEKGAFPLARYTDGQLPDEYDLEKGERREGLLIYQAPEDITWAELMFEEQYVDGENGSGYSVGERYTVRLKLG